MKLYQHYKGGLYIVIGDASDSNNTRPRDPLQVMYYSIRKGTWHIRTHLEFHEFVKQDEQGHRTLRFQEVVFPQDIRAQAP